MNLEQLERRLESTEEIRITVTDRESSRPTSRTVWFVLEGDRVYLVPVYGSDGEWFKDVAKTPKLRISAGGGEATARARPITDPARVRKVVDAFRAKYGADQIGEYYKKLDVAVEVPLEEE